MYIKLVCFVLLPMVALTSVQAKMYATIKTLWWYVPLKYPNRSYQLQNCHTSLVKPAVVPKPPCLACGGGCGGMIDLSHDQKLTLSHKQHLCFGGAANDVILTTAAARPIVIDEVVRTATNPADYVPADPVSLSVAYKLAQESCNRNEDKLAFGFRSLPKEVPLYTMKKINNIPEEDLFSLNGQIVELKKIKCDHEKSVDEEATDALLALADEEALIGEDDKVAPGQFKKITLGEIGYGPAKIKSASFVNVPGTPEALLEDIKNCDDGFKPGSVVIKQVPKNEPVSLPEPLPEPCPGEDEPFIPPPPAIPPGALFTSPYTYLSSSSSSASANKYSQSVFLQKVGCN
ncbi:hypothetical protein BDFB_008095 [Asbolus verrucosus]|uniref:Uncharacterized protein n=1 Tax=Asbolus verrucosus TaxID=1661398 RepID=A0A482VM28_ASBVE|nr:hypothetical protein BDFB_008095 [Asbolus verrucosus]